MRRCRMGVYLLLVLLVISGGVTWAMEKIHSPIEEDLNRAAESALDEDWAGSRRAFYDAWEDWEKWDHFRACFADHTPVEDISAAFRSLEVYCLQQEAEDFAARARELARKTAAVGEAHGLSWWNVL